MRKLLAAVVILAACGCACAMLTKSHQRPWHVPSDMQVPTFRPLKELFAEWPPLEAHIPDIPRIKEGTMKRFDWSIQADREEARRYRDRDVPFIAVNVPDVQRTTAKWTQEYMLSKFGTSTFHTSVSDNAEFMYFSKKSSGMKKKGYTPPTNTTFMTFGKWVDAIKEPVTPTDRHYYFITSLPQSWRQQAKMATKWMGEDLTMFDAFSPLGQPFWIINVTHFRGVNCRFAQQGIASTAHFDGSMNNIACLRGTKRYVLLAPPDCPNMYPLPVGDPSQRHSQVDWAHPDYEKYPKFENLTATQVVIQAGEMMYLPSFWVHFVVSVGDSYSIQCNAWSGQSTNGMKEITECGFGGLETALNKVPKQPPNSKSAKAPSAAAGSKQSPLSAENLRAKLKQATGAVGAAAAAGPNAVPQGRGV